MILHPLIDVLDRRGVEGGAESACAEEVRVGLQKRLFDGEILDIAQPDRVGERQFHVVVPGKGVQVERAERVQIRDRHAENALHLCFRVPVRTVRRHGERDEDRERGEQGVVAVVGLAVEPERKVGSRRRRRV